MQYRSSTPDLNRIGILTAAVLLAFALTRLLPASQLVLRLTLGNFFLTYPVSLTTVMTLLAAGITAAGMDWLLHSHPGLGSRRTVVEHWLLPTLTTFVIGVPLSLLPGGASWWVTFAFAALVLVTVFIAEYTAVDPAAPAYSAATGLLTALSFAVTLILLTTVRSSSPRLILIVPAVFIVSGLVALRSLHLRLRRWVYSWAGGIALIIAQLASALHYLPLSSIQYGLALLGPLYAMTSLAGGLGEDLPVRRATIEPVIALSLAWIAALFLG